MELLCTLGGDAINPDRTEKKFIGQGHKRDRREKRDSRDEILVKLEGTNYYLTTI